MDGTTRPGHTERHGHRLCLQDLSQDPKIIMRWPHLVKIEGQTG